MAYNNGIPQASDDPSQSQSQILANFQSIATVVAVNHEAFNDADEGKHKFLQMPEQSTAPSTAGNEIGLYSKDTGSNPELFFRPESDGTEIQMTNGGFTAAQNGISFLPGGFKLIWGQTTGTTGSKTFHTAFSTVLYNLQVSMIASGAAYGSQKNQSITGFDWTVSGTPSAIQYFAIGK